MSVSTVVLAGVRSGHAFYIAIAMACIFGKKDSGPSKIRTGVNQILRCGAQSKSRTKFTVN